MAGFVIAGLVMAGFVIAGFVMAGLVIAGFVTSKFVIAGFVMAGLVIAGLVIAGFVPSGFSVAEPVKPLGTRVPCGAVISAMLMVTLAVGFVDVTNTGRVALEVGGMLKSRVVSCENCRKDALPPGGWLAIVRR